MTNAATIETRMTIQSSDLWMQGGLLSRRETSTVFSASKVLAIVAICGC
jgi:hypothetical protein